MNVAYVYDAFSYDPGVQGAIDTLDYTEDQIIVFTDYGSPAVFAAPALLQNGEIYIGPAAGARRRST